MEIEITSLIGSPHFTPFNLSNNRATLGDNTAQLTWNASKQAAQDIAPPLLDTEEKKEAFKNFCYDSGGWLRREIAEWDEIELNALFLEWIAGDIREAFGDADAEEWDWEDYQTRAKEGQVSSRLFKANDGKIYFDLSN